MMRKQAMMLLVAVLALAPALVFGPAPKPQLAYATPTKITLTPSMVVNEEGHGDATLMVDEQSAAGDPVNGSGGTPTTQWNPGAPYYNNYPSHAYIDLGQVYNLTNISIFDTNGQADVAAPDTSQDLIVSTGSPGSWSTLFTDRLTNYLAWNNHTVNVSTRYVRLSVQYIGDNFREIVLYGTPAGGGDTTAPAAVTNFAAPSSTANSVTLTWTAPGDDGNTGTAASYDIRYSTSTITDANWASATQVSGEPTPSVAGTSQTMTVTGLSPGTTYYFAMKTSDEVPNVSALSNVASKATTAAASGKITLTTAMVVNEESHGNATLMVDEQATAGDPIHGAGGTPTTQWDPGAPYYNNYPSHAYIDLGQVYDLTGISIFDANGQADVAAPDTSQDLIVSTGSPGSWSTLFTDRLTNYLAWNNHTVSVSTRYVRFTVQYIGDNFREIVLYGTPTGTGGGDTTAPAAVTNLAAPSSTANSVTLTWTAPGDDGNTGTAASYDIRYSTSTITDANWASATQVSGEPVPAVAGTNQTMTVSGLSPSTTYYFAMKTSDEVPNVSTLSNVVNKATTAAASGKITLTPAMIINEAAIGDATTLVDEQSLAGDPKGGSGGIPVTQWDTTWNSVYYPASFVIDLGTTYNLTDIYFYDSDWGGSNVTVSSGTPFSWTTQFTEGLGSYQAWIARPVNISTRYLQFKIGSCCLAVSEIVLYGTPQGTPQSPPTPATPTLPTMDQLIGMNAFIDDPVSLMAPASFIREYHDWRWDEQTQNQNKFNPSYAGPGGWNFDSYYATLKANNLTVAPAINQAPSWLVAGSSDKPVSSGDDPLLPASYIEHAEHMFQYAARYGSTVVPDSKLKLAADQPRSTGLNTLTYFEDGNEQDKYWAGRAAYANPYELAAMLSADYDGHQGTMANAGVKTADPNAKLVMAGLVGLNLDYLKSFKLWSEYKRGGSLPFDVINMHHYSSDWTPTHAQTTGIRPEADNLKDKLKAVVDYRNQYMQGKEFWLTEFGYDTNAGSIQHAPAIGATAAEEVQADWLVRSYLAAAAAGVDKAVMFMIRDNNGASSQVYDSSGLTTNQASGEVPKISWYYVYTLKNRLTGMRYLSEASSGNANVRIYKFKNAAGSGGAYVVWAPTSNNTTVSNYQLSLAGTPTGATLVTMANGDTDGVPSSLAISGGKVTVNVSERPIFVLVDQMQ